LSLDRVACPERFELHDNVEGMGKLTGTLRCVMTTAVSFPLTAIAVTPAPEMALNAYSILHQLPPSHNESASSPT
jgi:hypothetical protein